MATTKSPSKFSRISDNKIDKIAELIITALNNCTADWHQPWLNTTFSVPASNLDYKKPFRGLNDFILNMDVSFHKYKTPYYLTHRQIEDMGLHLNPISYSLRDYKDADGNWVKRKETISLADYAALPESERSNYYANRERSVPVFLFYFRHIDKDGTKISSAEYNLMSEEDKKLVRSYPQLTCYDEWNIDQTDFATVFPDRYKKLIKQCTPSKKKVDQLKNASDPVLDYMLSGQTDSWRCPITHDGGDRAYYSPSTDSIHLPLRENFFSVSAYYGTALHECSHSNKPETHRDYGSKGFGSKGYATEELVAELSAAIMLHDLGIEKTIDEEHLAYVNSWSKACKDKDVIRTILDDLMSSVQYNLRWYDKTAVLLSTATKTKTKPSKTKPSKTKAA